MLARLPRMFARSAVALEDQTLASLLESNPAMGDEVALFHGDHANLAGSGGAIAEATLSAARLALRTQTGLNGQPINLVPWALVVPPALETTAEKIVSSVQATTTAGTNVFAGLRVIVDPRLTSATAWYVCADPMQTDGLLMAHLEGEEGVVVETKAGFDVDGVEVKARLDFGAAVADHRGWYKNPH